MILKATIIVMQILVYCDNSSRKCILPSTIRAETTPIIFGKMQFLLISGNEFTHEIKRDRILGFHGIPFCCAGVRLPPEDIIRLSRENSGTTILFKSALAAFNEDFKKKYMSSDGFPEDIIHFKPRAAADMVGVISSIPYSVGYIPTSAVKKYKVTCARIQNKNGKFMNSMKLVIPLHFIS